MTLAPDKVRHLKIGVPMGLEMLLVAWLGQTFSLALAIAVGTVLTAVAFELWQHFSKTGVPSWGDTAASSAAGLVLAGVLWGAGW